MELVDGTFYQANCDDTLVAIIADYPRPLPASRVSKAEALTSEEDSFLIPCLMHKYRIFIETTIGMWCRAPRGSSAKGIRARQAQEEGGQGQNAVAEV